MYRFLGSQLRHRRARTAGLLLAILGAAASFTLLAAAGKTTDVRVRGSVHSSFRPAYDILVRPRGSRTPLERDSGLVRPNYLSGMFGGITLAQYREIKRIRGVDVAAPVANIGYQLLPGFLPFQISDLLNKDPVQLYRLTTSWVAQRGLSRYPDAASYIYYTRRNPLDFSRRELLPDGRMLNVCGGFFPPELKGPFHYLGSLTCFSELSPQAWQDNWAGAHSALWPRGVGEQWYGLYPVFVSAIDPVQEARLVGLNKAVVSGRYLRENDAPEVKEPLDGNGKFRFVPVLASTKIFVDETASADVSRLRLPRGDVRPDLETHCASVITAASPFGKQNCSNLEGPGKQTAYNLLTSLRGTRVGRRDAPLSTAWKSALRGEGYSFPSLRVTGGSNYWTTSPTRYRIVGKDRLAPIPVTNPISEYKTKGYPGTGDYLPMPPATQDLQFRRLHTRVSSNLFRQGVAPSARLYVVGEYDPSRIAEFSPLSRVPLETYAPPLLEPGDARTNSLLHGRPLLPTQNLGDYVQQPPLILTTLAGLKPFLDSELFARVPAAEQRAPISVIRVRVSGVKGADALSVARIKNVAGEIHDKTGLDVDITAGSSPHPVLIDLPAGKFGRPALTLKEGWSKKGVSVSFLNALDRKRLGFLILILVTSAFVVANGAFASVRQRRREIGTLLSLGWTQRQIFAAVLSELALVGLLAGLLGAGLAAVVSAASSLSLSAWQALLVVPLALLLALVAGLLPAWRASRLLPLDAVRPAIAGEVEGRRVRHLLALALVNLRRVPARSLVAAGGLMVGVAALTLLVGIDQSFQGTLVGTLLGSAISLQVSGLDFLAVGLIVGLSALALADVLYVNLRERQAELVTLKTFGWSDRHLQELVALEAALLGAAGSLGGALAGIVLGALVGLPLLTLLVAALVACAGGLLVALAASLFPASRIGRFSVPTVLAEE